MNELKRILRGVEALKKDMEELGVEVKVSVSIPIPHISLMSTVVIEGQLFNVAKEFHFPSSTELSSLRAFGRKIEFEPIEVEAGEYIIGLDFHGRRGVIFKKEPGSQVAKHTFAFSLYSAKAKEATQ